MFLLRPATKDNLDAGLLESLSGFRALDERRCAANFLRPPLAILGCEPPGEEKRSVWVSRTFKHTQCLTHSDGRFLRESRPDFRLGVSPQHIENSRVVNPTYHGNLTARDLKGAFEIARSAPDGLVLFELFHKLNGFFLAPCRPKTDEGMGASMYHEFPLPIRIQTILPGFWYPLSWDENGIVSYNPRNETHHGQVPVGAEVLDGCFREDLAPFQACR